MSLRVYIPDSVILDNQQEELLEVLEGLSKKINKKSFFHKLFKSQKYSGVYLWGSVGRGKTVLFRAFYDSLKVEKKIFYHYQSFARYLHEEAHKYFLSGKKDYVKALAEKLSKSYEVIIIDELEIRDITDAMLIQRIVQILIDNGTFIGFTSNIKPDNLYLDGLQRELFLGFINQVNSEFLLLNLDSSIDYRFRKISDGKSIILDEKSESNDIYFDQLVNSLTHNKDFRKDEINLFGRKVEFARVFRKILYLEISEIIEQELSYNDFLAISEKYDAVILLADKKIQNDSNHAIRFINFIDNIYANKLLFIAYFCSRVGEFCESLKYEAQFKRAASRIAEMNSADYINQSKYYGEKNG
jgi:cell division protein ZapE